MQHWNCTMTKRAFKHGGYTATKDVNFSFLFLNVRFFFFFLRFITFLENSRFFSSSPVNIIGAFLNSFAKPNHPNFLWVVYIHIVSRFTFAGYFRLHIYCILTNISVRRAKWLQQVNVAVWLKKKKKKFLTQLFHILDTFHPWTSEERFSPRPSTMLLSQVKNKRTSVSF